MISCKFQRPEQLLHLLHVISSLSWTGIYILLLLYIHCTDDSRLSRMSALLPKPISLTSAPPWKPVISSSFQNRKVIFHVGSHCTDHPYPFGSSWSMSKWYRSWIWAFGTMNVERSPYFSTVGLSSFFFFLLKGAIRAVYEGTGLIFFVRGICASWVRA